MISTILFDLDGTLLPIDTDNFIKEYMKLITVKLAPYIEPKKVPEYLMKSTYKMIQDKNPQKTNREVFMEDFLSKVCCCEEEITRVFMSFYTKEFKALKCCVKEHPEIHKIITILQNKNVDIVVATNPIFPEIAIKERLRWIDAHTLPFKLITSYENMHFCKPHVEYYEEILSKINKKPDECLMVGNDVEEDLAARKVGIKTFLVKNFLINKSNAEYVSDYIGSYTDLVSFLKNL